MNNRLVNVVFFIILFAVMVCSVFFYKNYIYIVLQEMSKVVNDDNVYYFIAGLFGSMFVNVYSLTNGVLSDKSQLKRGYTPLFVVSFFTLYFVLSPVFFAYLDKQTMVNEMNWLTFTMFSILSYFVIILSIMVGRFINSTPE